jgi:hypothetical protein
MVPLNLDVDPKAKSYNSIDSLAVANATTNMSA